ncbi:MAG: hypothetical protein ACOY16_02575 [Chloroflexota bacterium]
MRAKILGWMIFVSVILGGCTLDTSGTGKPLDVWLESPLPESGDISISLGTSLPIYGHIRQKYGRTVQRAYLMDRDTPLLELTLTSEGENLFSAHTVWTPITGGEYRLKIRAESNLGEKEDSKTVKVIVTSFPMIYVTPTETTAVTLPSIELVTMTPSQTPTEQPPATSTPTYTVIPTMPPTVTRSPTPWPPVEADFWADRTSLAKGECTQLHWQVKHATSVLLNNKKVESRGSQKVCPAETSGYDLLAKAPSGDVLRELTITVTTPQDTTPPPVPTPLQPGVPDPNNPVTTPCIPLQWSAVSDPSGVTYFIELERKSGGKYMKLAEWHDISGTSQNMANMCASGYYYRWRVRARDGAGNWSSSSPWFYFATPII